MALHGAEYHTDGCALCRRQAEQEQLMRGIGFKRGNCSKCKTDKPHSPRCIDWIDTELPENPNEQAPAAIRQRAASSKRAGAHMLKMIVDPLSKLITEWIAEAESGKPGPKVSAYPFIRAVSEDAAAYLTAKTTLDSITSDVMEQTVMVDIGRAIEEEVCFQRYHEQLPALFDTIVRDHEKRKKKTQRTARVVKAKIRQAGGKFDGWSETDCATVGAVCLGLFMQVEVGKYGPIVERVPMRVRKKKQYKAAYRLSLCDGIKPLIEMREDLSSLLAPGFLPSVIPPKPWTSPFDGMYWTRYLDRKARRLVKTRSMEYLEDLSQVLMPKVYEAVNIVQNTPWRVNKPVLEVMHKVWGVGQPVGKLPAKEDELIPTTPTEVPPCQYNEDKDRYKAWRDETPEGHRWREWLRSAAFTYEQNEASKSRRLQTGKLLWIADMYKDDEAFYFPHQMDFRSRLYAVPMFLQPQGPDPSRGLLEFAIGKPIAEPGDAEWLAIHGANTYGIDKVSFADRVQWVEAHEAEIKDVAENPMSSSFWRKADNPWQFLAFCFEWYSFLVGGYGFVSHLPVAVDGTCNGLQHFSAMLRDPIGGTAVNLLPAPKPQDIYQTVADKAIKALKTSADDGDFAPRWLSLGVDRKLTKRSVMILPYGGTQFAGRSYIEQDVRKKGEHPFAADMRPAVTFFTKVVWDAIGETVIAAKDAMQWIKKSASTVTKLDPKMAINWTTPDGFPVRQAYMEMEENRVRLQFGGGRVQRMTEMETKTLDSGRQVTGLSPNFVHSLDATALRGSVLASGLTDFAMVHDSYGTHAASMSTLAGALRHAFVDLYTAHKPLEELRDALLAGVPDAKLDALPVEGNLNINDVLEATFFFA